MFTSPIEAAIPYGFRPATAFRRDIFAVASIFLFVAVTIASPLDAAAQRATNHDEPLSERRVSYDIDVSLDPETKTIGGTERLLWRNPDIVPVSELQFHLYLNAFRDGSTFMKESGGIHRGFSASGENRFGGIEIQRMTRVDATPDVARLGGNIPIQEDLTDKIQFIQPDDNYGSDMTVISVELAEPVQPGETIALDIDFESRLPMIIARTGWAETEDGELFVFAGQWFPKIGVREVPGQRYIPADAPQGEWNTHQFHANSEFYADFGTYDVSITVPEDYLVGASGVQTDETASGSAKTMTYRAEDVHDFAWTASPAYVEHTDQWRHVNIRVLLQPQHAGQAVRHADAAKVSLEYFDKWLGEYPYTSLTLIDGIGGSNGMEYPTLITCGTFYGIPEWMRVPLELVTIHEFGHQYFYGLLASNEFEEAWLDEGMNSFLETRIMDDAYGSGAVIDLPGLPIGSADMQRLSYTKNNPDRGAIFTRSWEYQFGDYGKASYAKPATVMNTLEGIIGREKMETFLREYYARWRFKHPTTKDLQDVAEDVAGADLDWFFDQFVYGTAVVDYELGSINVTRLRSAASDSTDLFRSRVRLHRAKDGVVPQTVLVQFEDGTTESVEWDGQDEWKDISFERPQRVTEAFIDPENLVLLDINRLNNRKAVNGANPFSRKIQLKSTVWFQQLVYGLFGLI